MIVFLTALCAVLVVVWIFCVHSFQCSAMFDILKERITSNCFQSSNKMYICDSMIDLLSKNIGGVSSVYSLRNI